MKNKILLIAITLILIPSLAYAGLFEDLKSLFDNLFQWTQEQKAEQQELGAATVVYPGSGGTGTSTIPVKGDLLIGSSNRKYNPLASSTAYSLLTVSSTAPYGLGWSTQIGASTNRLDAFLDDLDATTMNIGGTASGNLNMGNYSILNANQIKANYFTATSTTLSSTFAGGIISQASSTFGGTSTTTFEGGLRASANAALVVNQAASANSLYIAANGNVGIGTAPASAKLHILQTGTADALRVDDVAGDSSPFVIDQTGNVGIGDTTPNYELHIHSTEPNIQLTDEDLSSGATSGLLLTLHDNVNGADVDFWNFQEGYIRFATDNLERLRITSLGNVGIGTAGPSELLTVFSATDPTFQIGTGSATTTISGLTTATSTIISGLSAGNNAAFVVNQAASANSLYIAANGNVGIGTTAPGYKLTVSGGAGSISGGDLTVSSAGSATTTISSGVSKFAGGIISQASSTFTNNIELIGNLTISSSTGSLYQPIYGSDDGLVLYLPFSEGMTSSSANIAYDRSPYGNDGTATGMPMPTRNATSGESGWSTTTCKVGSCMSFDGVNDYVNIADAASLNITGSFTIEAWVYIRSWPSIAPTIYSRFSLDSGIELRREGDGIRLIIADGVSWTQSAATDSDTPFNQWHHIAGTYDGANMRLYINSILKGGPTASNAPATSSVAGQIGIRGAFNPWDGLIDEVRVYNRALSADEIRTHYLRGEDAHGAVLADKFRIIGTDNNIDFIVSSTANRVSVGIATTTPETELVVNSVSATSTITIYSGSATLGGCVEIEGADGTWAHFITASSVIVSAPGRCE